MNDMSDSTCCILTALVQNSLEIRFERKFPLSLPVWCPSQSSAANCLRSRARDQL